MDVGEGDARQIVCGAWNFEAGATVAVALPGADLPILDQPLDERELRGEPSRGMIPPRTRSASGRPRRDHGAAGRRRAGLPLVDVLPIRDQVLDVTPTVNRVDLLSMVGIAARSPRSSAEICIRPTRTTPRSWMPEEVDVTVDDFDACPRYIGRVFRDVRDRRLAAVAPLGFTSRDMRSISNVVDVTNYVMHVWGSPLRVRPVEASEGRIVVRERARESCARWTGRSVGSTRTTSLITDGEHAVALAAIMGGEDSEVTEETREVLLEAAANRAARDPPLVGAPRAPHSRIQPLGEGRRSPSRRARGLLAADAPVDLAGAAHDGHADVHAGLPERPVVRFRPERA